MTAMLPPPKTLVLLFDGTGNFFKQENTNIVRLFEALENDRPDTQLLYYQPGVGKDSRSSIWMLLTETYCRHIHIANDLVGQHISPNRKIGG